MTSTYCWDKLNLVASSLYVSLLLASCFSHSYIRTYLINWMATLILHTKSPFEAIFHTLPNYTKLKTFGCLYYPWLYPYAQHKLDQWSKPYIFLRYSTTQSAYKCLDFSTNKIYLSHHVRFVEDVFLFSKDNSIQPTTSGFQQWPSYTPFLASLSATPFLVPHSHPFNSSMSMSLPLSTSSNIEVVSPFHGSQSGMSSTLDSCGDITPTPFYPSSSLPNPTQFPFIPHHTHFMTTT